MIVVLPKLCLHHPNDSEQVMLALLIWFEGLGILSPRKSAHKNYQFSVSITLIFASSLPLTVLFSNSSIPLSKRLYLSSM